MESTPKAEFTQVVACVTQEVPVVTSGVTAVLKEHERRLVRSKCCVYVRTTCVYLSMFCVPQLVTDFAELDMKVYRLNTPCLHSLQFSTRSDKQEHGGCASVVIAKKCKSVRLPAVWDTVHIYGRTVVVEFRVTHDGVRTFSSACSLTERRK
jgi:hypothetical protein